MNSSTSIPPDFTMHAVTIARSNEPTDAVGDPVFRQDALDPLVGCLEAAPPPSS